MASELEVGKLKVGDTHGEVTLNNTSGTSGSTVLSQTYNGGVAELRIGSNISTAATSAMNVITGDAGNVKFNGDVQIGQYSVQGGALLAVRNQGDSINFGHNNAAGYGSTIGAGEANGWPHLALMCEAGTNANTFKTRGLKGNVIYATNTGELKFGQVTTADADNQTVTERFAISSDGLATFSGGITVSGGITTLGSMSELTIASGGITVTSSVHTVDTQGDASSDNLNTINGGSTGSILVLTTADSSRDVTLKDDSDNLRLAGDCVLASSNDSITLIKNGTIWRELSRSNNS
jgi:hypothetical protein